MKKILLLSLFFFIFDAEPITIGERVSIHSNTLQEERELLVYTPFSYGSGANNYPVIYLLDGNTHFHHVSGIVNFLSMTDLMPEMIVVGIANTNRFRDFSPSPYVDSLNDDSKYGADNFLQFIKNEMIPYIEDKYRTIPSHRTVVGHSYGGLFSIYTSVKNPELFRNNIAISPYLAWNDSSMISTAKQFFVKHTDIAQYLYITMGAESPQLQEAISAFVKMLSHDAPKTLHWQFKNLSESHTRTPHQSVYSALTSIYVKWPIPEEISRNGDINGLVKHYKETVEKFGIKPTRPQMMLSGMAEQYLSEKNYTKLIEVNLSLLEISSKSATKYYQVAYAYKLNNQLKLALEYLEKTVQLAEENNNESLSIYMESMTSLKKLIKETP